MRHVSWTFAKKQILENDEKKKRKKLLGGKEVYRKVKTPGLPWALAQLSTIRLAQLRFHAPDATAAGS
jgi:hypothetical protein